MYTKPTSRTASAALRAGGALLLLLVGAGCDAGAERRALRQLRADLHAVGVQQIRFRDVHGRYARSAQELGLRPHADVRIEIPRLGDAGYLARGTHAAIAAECTLAVGDLPSRTSAEPPRGLHCAPPAAAHSAPGR